MRKIILYIAISLDGKIAKPDDDIQWLEDIPAPEENPDYGYKEFYASIDTTLMGHNTFKVMEGFEVPFPYPDTTNYVFTRQKDLQDTEHVKFISGDIVAFAKELKAQEGKDIWLIGGGQINTVFLNAGLIDEMHVAVIPIVLGEGIPLFGGKPEETRLKVAGTEVFSNGMVMVKYAV